MALHYKTRGGSDPKGKPRVYFCCHPKNLERFLEPISNELLAKQNCAIWYASADAVRDEAFLDDLLQMQLFVMPVTRELLQTENPALAVEFPFALEHHIPVLPLLQDSTLTEQFNRSCGDLHLLNKRQDGTEAISYDEKLRKYLSEVLIGDELTERVRSAFDAYVFLSYRKKDRRHARELMGLIHQNRACRDIAIWYDEFLTPGENFNQAIADALRKSGLFVLTVTPNLVCENNYVRTHEYPLARAEGKPIVPAQLVPTDHGTLAEQYEGIPTPTDAHDRAALSDALLKAIQALNIQSNDDSPEHNYLIGLAYLGGIDVEVDTALAVESITKAAEAGLPEAVDKLYCMYLYGNGVERNPKKALSLLLRYARHCKKQFARTGDLQFARSYVDSMTRVSLQRMAAGQLQRARLDLLALYTHFHYRLLPRISAQEATPMEYTILDATYQVRFAMRHYGAAQSICRTMTQLLREMDPKDEPMFVALELFRLCRRLARLELLSKNYHNARLLYTQNIEEVVKLTATLRVPADRWGWLGVAYHDLAELCYAQGDIEQGDAYATKVLDSLRTAHSDGDVLLPDSHQNLGISYTEVADIKLCRGDLADGRSNYQEAVAVFRQLVQERRTDGAVRHLAKAIDAVADIDRALGDLPQAEAGYREALALYETVDEAFPEEHLVLFTRLKLAILDGEAVDAGALAALKLQFQRLHRTDPDDPKITEALSLLENHGA